MRALLSSVLLIASLAGAGYLAVAVQRTLAFGRRRHGPMGTLVGSKEPTPHEFEPTPLDFLPPVTILKPLRGDEPGLFENLQSFCDQDYPEFQVIFGVHDARDPAADIAREVIDKHPGADQSLVVDGQAQAANRKIASVLNMMAKARHDVIVVADSDIRVDRSYLRRIVAPFSDPQVGAVTCLYRAGVSGLKRGVVQQLAAMFVEEQFAPSVLVAVALSPMDFCLGATMAVTRPALEAIGGFEAIAPYLADDRMLGKFVRDSGLHVELSPYVVETSISDAVPRELWDHELRWARTMHAARPLGYSFSFITYALPLALAYALASGNAILGGALVGLTGALRLALHYAARSALATSAPDALWLVPLRDTLGLAVWAAHFFGNGIRWRNERFRVDRSGQILPLDRADG